MYNNILLLFAISFQLMQQILQLSCKLRTAASPAGKSHISCIIFIPAKFAFTFIKRIHAVITAASAHYQMTLNDNNQLTHSKHLP